MLGSESAIGGGWAQVVLKTTKAKPLQSDTMKVFKGPSRDGQLMPAAMTPEQLRQIRPSRAQDRGYTALREQINDPHLTGPFDTGWPMTDFDAQLSHVKVGLPTLPGQVTNAK